MNHTALLEELRNLEMEMHLDATRRSRERMLALLHPGFVEFGRSGRRYSLDEILEEIASNSGNEFPVIQSSGFELVLLAEGVALLTYVSAHEDANGNTHRHSLRSSIWVRTDQGWQVRFHQGTPTSHGDLNTK